MRDVALHPEGVDRNHGAKDFSRDAAMSPSTRRAWIEIYKVAMLKSNGVDRNSTHTNVRQTRKQSPSTRRAWIEISPKTVCITSLRSRPPPGGRG